MAKLRVLLIDDEPMLLDAIGAYFQKLGHQVFRAEDGRAGIAAFDRVHPDVTVCDLRMPELDGLQVLAILKEKGGVVLMLTGHGEIGIAVEAMKLGAENFLTKPVDMPHLVQVVEKAAEKAAMQREIHDLRRKLTPSLKRNLMRFAAVLALLVGAALLGQVIGGSGKVEANRKPIPVPLNADSVVKR